MSPENVTISYTIASQIAQILAQAPAGAVAEPFVALLAAIRAAEAQVTQVTAPPTEAL